MKYHPRPLSTKNLVYKQHAAQYASLLRPTNYQYDPNDNRTQKTDSGQSTIYDITPGSNQLEAIDNQPLLYDNAGNLTQDRQGKQYLYNNAGKFWGHKVLESSGDIILN